MTAKLKFTNLSENAIIFFRYAARLPREYWLTEILKNLTAPILGGI